MEVSRQEGAGAHAKDINMPGGNQLVHHPVEHLPVDLLDRNPDLLHIHLQNGGHHIGAEQPVVGGPDALNGGQLAADHLLEGLLHGGIAVVAQQGREAHHRGLADPGQLAQPAGGHKGGLVIIGEHIGGNPLLSFGKAGHVLLNRM